MKFRPLHDRVVVERIDPEGKSAGGIIIPDTAQEKPSQGQKLAELAKCLPRKLDSQLMHATECCGIDLAVEAVVEDLKKNSKKVTSNEEIAHVGTIA